MFFPIQLLKGALTVRLTVTIIVDTWTNHRARLSGSEASSSKKALQVRNTTAVS